MQVNTSQCFIPTVSNQHKLLGTSSEETTWRFLFPWDFCTEKDLLPGTWTKYRGWVKCRSAALGRQMGGLISFEWIICFLSSTVPFLSHQTDVLYSSNTLFSLLSTQNGKEKRHSQRSLLWVQHSGWVVACEGSHGLGQGNLMRKVKFKVKNWVWTLSLIVRVGRE